MKTKSAFTFIAGLIIGAAGVSYYLSSQTVSQTSQAKPAHTNAQEKPGTNANKPQNPLRDKLLLEPADLSGLTPQQLQCRSEIITILKFVYHVKQGNKAEVAKFIKYPLSRSYTIKPVDTPEEFVQRYDSIFDKSIVDKIANSSFVEPQGKYGDWSKVGYRGIMFRRGAIWFGNYSCSMYELPTTQEDFDKLKISVNEIKAPHLASEEYISAVLYSSPAECKEINHRLKADRKQLYKPLQNYKSPITKFETKTHRIRIDYMPDETYRYASWKLGRPISAKPDLVIKNGDIPLDYQNARGTTYLVVFKNKGYTYIWHNNCLKYGDHLSIHKHPPNKNWECAESKKIAHEEVSKFYYNLHWRRTFSDGKIDNFKCTSAEP